jgi:glutathione S-transferase
LEGADRAVRNATLFEFRMLDPSIRTITQRSQPVTARQIPAARRWGDGRGGGQHHLEHLQAFHPGPVQLIPANPAAAIRVRMLDRIFSNYVTEPAGYKASSTAYTRSGPARKCGGIEKRRVCFSKKSYAWLDTQLSPGEWAANTVLASAEATPQHRSLFYADWVHPIPEPTQPSARLSRRLLARPSVLAPSPGAPYRPVPAPVHQTGIDRQNPVRRADGAQAFTVRCSWALMAAVTAVAVGVKAADQPL